MVTYCTIWYHIEQYGTILYNMVPYCTILYYIILYYIGVGGMSEAPYYYSILQTTVGCRGSYGAVIRGLDHHRPDL